MNRLMKKGLSLAFSLTLLTACGLSVDSSDQASSQTGNISQPLANTGNISQPLANTGNSSNSSNTSNTSNASNTSNTSNTSQASSIPSTNSQGLTAQTLLQKSNDAMLAAQSYEYTAETTSNFGGKDLVSTTKSALFPAQGDGVMESDEGEGNQVTYLKDNRMYLRHRGTNQWVYVDMDPADRTPVTISPQVNNFMKVEERQGQTVVYSTRPLDAEEYYMLSGSETKELASLRDMQSKGITMETLVTYVLDSAYRQKTVLFEQVTTQAGVSTYNKVVYDYDKYDEVPPIQIPQEILDEAIPISEVSPKDGPDPNTKPTGDLTKPETNTKTTGDTKPKASTKGPGSTKP